MYARIGNLSEGGLFLRTSTPLDEGSKAIVRFGPGDPGEIELKAEVVWARDDGGAESPGMGLRFDPLDGSTLERVRALVAREQRNRRTDA